MKRRAQSTRSAGEAGFTLLELLAALVLMALAAVMIAPQTGRGLAAMSWRAGVLEMASEFRAARSQALRTSRTQTVRFDPRARTYARDGSRQPRALPNGTTLAVAGSEDRAAVRFLADGTSTGARLRLTDGQRKAEIAIDSVTGAIEVLWQ